MSRNLTVLHIIESLGLGGAEKALVQMVNAMPQYKHIVVILTEPEVLKEKLSNATFINLNSTTFFQRFAAAKRLRKIIIENKVDLVHAQLFNSTLVGRRASKGLVPFVFTLQSMLGEDLFKRNFIARILEEFTYSKKNFIIAVSNEALSDYEKYIATNKLRTKVIYNSIERKFFANAFKEFTPANKVRLIAVGNLKPLKNYDYIFDALHLLDKELFELDVYGDGTHKEHLQKRIVEEKLPVTLKGNVSDLNKRISNYDIYLHCSKYEGSSLAVFEAMASGLPLIVSDIPVLRENTGGFAIYANLADANSLAVQLMTSFQNPELLNEPGRKGFDWVKTVADPAIVIEATLDYYKYILQEK